MSYKVAIDCGHGYNTAGKRTPAFTNALLKTEEGITVSVSAGEQVREHFANVGVAYFLKNALERCNIQTYMSVYGGLDGYMNDVQFGTTGTTDVVGRQSDIRQQNCDVCVSLHFNAYGDGRWNSAEGIEMYYHSVAEKVGDGKRLAQAIWYYLKDASYGQRQRGIKTSADYGMCNSTALHVRGAVLIEHAFMTNEYEAINRMCSPTAWKLYAEAEAHGICDYLGVQYIEDGGEQTEEAETGNGAGQDVSEIIEEIEEEISQPSTPSTPSEPATVHLYRVQCGAFSERKFADKLEVKLRVNGVNFWKQIEADGLIHVYAGSYNKRGNAVQQSRLLTNLGIANCIKEVL